MLQVLGQLIYDNPQKVEKTLPTFRAAAARRSQDAAMWELLGELLAPRDPPGALKAYQLVLELHRKKQKEVKALQDEFRATNDASGGGVGAAAKKGGKKKGRDDDDGMGDLFGSDDDEDDAEDVAEGAEDPAAAAAAVHPDHVLPPKLLNNAAVLLYR